MRLREDNFCGRFLLGGCDGRMVGGRTLGPSVPTWADVGWVGAIRGWEGLIGRIGPISPISPISPIGPISWADRERGLR